jgi:isoleucyl-tRNA synthetase
MVQGTGLPESVHLTDWPSVKEPDTASHKLLEEMKKARGFIVEGLAQRAAAGVKVRQPLQTVDVPKIMEGLKAVVAEELNVKEVVIGSSKVVKLNSEVTPELKSEGLARDLIRVIQNARKNAGFNVDDRIETLINSDSTDVVGSLEKFKELIDAETLSVGLLDDAAKAEHSETVKVEGQEVSIALKRA